MSKKTSQCLFKECGRSRVSRGLCLSHYQMACAVVKKGLTTFAILEKKGRVLPRKKAEGKQFTTWLLQ